MQDSVVEEVVVCKQATTEQTTNAAERDAAASPSAPTRKKKRGPRKSAPAPADDDDEVLRAAIGVADVERAAALSLFEEELGPGRWACMRKRTCKGALGAHIAKSNDE